MKDILKILVPTDFSSFSLVALDEAIELAKLCGARIHLLHVIESFPTRGIGVQGNPVAETTVDRLREEARERMAALEGRFAGTDHTIEVRCGIATDEIVACADQIRADVILMATHGRRGLARLFMGSTTEAVLRRAKCAVMSVRPSTAAIAAAPPPTASECKQTGRLPLKVRDIMRRDLVSVTPETPLSEVVALMVRHDISGIPVIDEKETMLGYIPESQLLTRALNVAGKESEDACCCTVDRFIALQRQIYGQTAKDIMRERHEVITINEGAEMTEAIQRMLNHGVSRLPVLRRGRLVGYLTRADILRTLLDMEGMEGRLRPEDHNLGHIVRETLLRDPNVAIQELGIRSDDGVVWLTGKVSSLEELDEINRAVGQLPGVRSVANCMVVSR